MINYKGKKHNILSGGSKISSTKLNLIINTFLYKINTNIIDIFTTITSDIDSDELMRTFTIFNDKYKDIVFSTKPGYVHQVSPLTDNPEDIMFNYLNDADYDNFRFDEINDITPHHKITKICDYLFNLLFNNLFSNNILNNIVQTQINDNEVDRVNKYLENAIFKYITKIDNIFIIFNKLCNEQNFNLQSIETMTIYNKFNIKYILTVFILIILCTYVFNSVVISFFFYNKFDFKKKSIHLILKDIRNLFYDEKWIEYMPDKQTVLLYINDTFFISIYLELYKTDIENILNYIFSNKIILKYLLYNFFEIYKETGQFSDKYKMFYSNTILQKKYIHGIVTNLLSEPYYNEFVDFTSMFVYDLYVSLYTKPHIEKINHDLEKKHDIETLHDLETVRQKGRHELISTNSVDKDNERDILFGNKILETLVDNLYIILRLTDKEDKPIYDDIENFKYYIKIIQILYYLDSFTINSSDYNNILIFCFIVFIFNFRLDLENINQNLSKNDDLNIIQYYFPIYLNQRGLINDIIYIDNVNEVFKNNINKIDEINQNSEKKLYAYNYYLYKNTQFNIYSSFITDTFLNNFQYFILEIKDYISETQGFDEESDNNYIRYIKFNKEKFGFNDEHFDLPLFKEFYQEIVDTFIRYKEEE